MKLFVLSVIRGLEAVVDSISEIGKLYVGTSGMDKSPH